ncbi:acetate--CoA ligase [Patescibacteria group bacterium]|nr:acetate--CoA ligase [Patescibacteria group bacterium]MBU1931732.1 acetate--CoA ligase [Patescibacteria group bacterium]
MQKPKLITKQKLKFIPNLINYQKTYDSFNYKEHYKQVNWLDKDHLNAAYAAMDANVLTEERKNKVALYWHGPDDEQRKFTFQELTWLSSQFANVLKTLGIDKGERVFFFLPRVPELYYGFLGTLKTGAIAGTLFAAFGHQALLDRLENSDAKILVTNSQLFPRVEKIWPQLPQLKYILLTDALQNKNKKLLSLPNFMELAPQTTHICRTEPTDPAFMLYTSGTTGKPKGVIHQHLAIVHEYMTAKWVLDLQENDVYWCTADPGWVTGIAYEILGSWANGAASLIHAGRFDPDKWYQLIQDYKVNVWYTAPTAVRMLAAGGLKTVQKYDLSSLRHMASVGEPLNPDAIWWGLKAFGLPFHDNWWQTETGGILIANYPCLAIKPGSMGKPFPGITADIVDDKGKSLPLLTEGHLAIKPGWPSMMQKIWRRPKKYQSYFNKGWYISGDQAYKDKDGYFWFIGRDDDVIKTAGERVGPFEVESALVAHPKIIEAGVIGKPDPMRGQIIKAFIVLAEGVKPGKTFEEEIKTFVKRYLAGHAYPREIEIVDSLPKTRSGKIVRRFLRAKELGLPIGDTSTLEKF